MRPLSMLTVPLCLLATLGCDLPDLRLVSSCPTHAEVVDETTGAVDFVVDRADDCKEPREFPNTITFVRLDDVGSAALLCDSPGTLLYEAVELMPDSLRQALFEPVDSAVGLPATGATVEDGDWLRVTYWHDERNGSTSEGPWTVLFQLGDPGSGFNESDCLQRD